MTYVKALGEKDKVDDPSVPKYSTQWRWYYDEKCIEFGSVGHFSLIPLLLHSVSKETQHGKLHFFLGRV